VNPIEIHAARSGDVTASFDGRHVHSRVDPRREAERFVAGRTDADWEFVVVIGGGLGYIYPALRAALPGCRVLGCSLIPDITRYSYAEPDDLWIDGQGESLSDFLSRHVGEIDATSVGIIEWAPVTELVPDRAVLVRDELSRLLRRYQASLVTQGATGRRWLRNALHNYLHVRAAVPERSAAMVSAVVVVGAGPSLEDSLERLVPLRGRVALWVTASALDAVVARGLVPDLVIVSDGALYAAEHLRQVIAGRLSGVPVAAPLAATRGISSCEYVSVIREGDPVDSALLAFDDTPATAVPPRGTVSATALALARLHCAAPIVLVGTDFAWRSSRSHARPHLSELYRAAGSCRTTPHQTLVFRSVRDQRRLDGEWQTDRTLQTYADWFDQFAPTYFGPVYALAPSPMLRLIPRVEAEEIAAMPCTFPSTRWKRGAWPDHETRTQRVERILDDLDRTIAATAQPRRRRDLSRGAPAFVSLAIRLALPFLLRWYRAPQQTRTEHWVRLVAELGQEVASLRGIIR
jgi:hypothetical protein